MNVDDDQVIVDGADSEPGESRELAPRVMELVQRVPGQRTAAIADALGVTTAMLAPTLRMLVQRNLRAQKSRLASAICSAAEIVRC